MTDNKEEIEVSLCKSFFICILLNALVLAIIGTTLGVEAIIVACVIVFAHLVCSVGLVFYRSGDLTKKDSEFIRFGVLVVLWRVLN